MICLFYEEFQKKYTTNDEYALLTYRQCFIVTFGTLSMNSIINIFIQFMH